jgi:hypothetical protein
MAHPFEKMFYKALKKCTKEHNEVIVVSTNLATKGYSPREIAEVLQKLHRGLIDKEEVELVAEALEEFKHHLPDREDEES